MISYTIKIDGVKTTAVGSLQDVVKQVNYTVTGTNGEQSFSLPIKAMLEDPTPNNFVTFNNLTEPKVVSWVETLPETVAAKEHIDIVVQKMVSEAVYKDAVLPWGPPPPGATPAGV